MIVYIAHECDKPFIIKILKMWKSERICSYYNVGNLCMCIYEYTKSDSEKYICIAFKICEKICWHLTQVKTHETSSAKCYLVQVNFIEPVLNKRHLFDLMKNKINLIWLKLWNMKWIFYIDYHSLYTQYKGVRSWNPLSAFISYCLSSDCNSKKRILQPS